MVDSTLTTATLAETVQFVSPLSRNTILGDTNHASIDQQLAMISPDVIRAAARTGKTAMIVEYMSTPVFAEAYELYYRGEKTIDEIRDWMMKSRPNFMNDADRDRLNEGFVQVFQTLKENNMHLLAVNRQDGLLPSEQAHPEFVALFKQIQATMREGGTAAVQAFAERLTAEHGPDYLPQYNAWFAQRVREANNADVEGIRTSMQAAGNPRALILWGDSHNENANDLNEMLGNSRVISIYPSTSEGQILGSGGINRTVVPDFVYYVAERQAGMPDQGLNISTFPKNVSFPDDSSQDLRQAMVASLENNSLAGTARWRLNIPHIETNGGELGTLARVDDFSTRLPTVSATPTR